MTDYEATGMRMRTEAMEGKKITEMKRAHLHKMEDVCKE